MPDESLRTVGSYPLFFGRYRSTPLPLECSQLMDVGLVVEMNSNLSLVTYDSATHRTFGLCLLRFEGNAQRLMRRIERLPNFAISPLFAPVVIAGIAVHDMRTYSNTIIVESFTMESAQ